MSKRYLLTSFQAAGWYVYRPGVSKVLAPQLHSHGEYPTPSAAEADMPLLKKKKDDQ